MDGHAFDALVARLTSGTSRRGAMRGIAGGALTSVGAVALADDATGKGKGKGRGKSNRKDKGKKGRKRAAAETNAVGNGKRILCFCPDANPLNCSTKRLKTKRAKKRLKKFPNSYRGKCDPVVTTAAPPTAAPTTAAPTTTVTTSSTTVTPTTTSTPTSTQPPTSSDPSTSEPPTSSDPSTSEPTTSEPTTSEPPTTPIP